MCATTIHLTFMQHKLQITFVELAQANPTIIHVRKVELIGDLVWTAFSRHGLRAYNVYRERQSTGLVLGMVNSDIAMSKQRSIDSMSHHVALHQAKASMCRPGKSSV